MLFLILVTELWDSYYDVVFHISVSTVIYLFLRDTVKDNALASIPVPVIFLNYNWRHTAALSVLHYPDPCSSNTTSLMAGSWAYHPTGPFAWIPWASQCCKVMGNAGCWGTARAYRLLTGVHCHCSHDALACCNAAGRT